MKMKTHLRTLTSWTTGICEARLVALGALGTARPLSANISLVGAGVRDEGIAAVETLAARPRDKTTEEKKSEDDGQIRDLNRNRHYVWSSGQTPMV